jgi:hypothetical protein
MPEGSFTCRKSTTWDRRLYFPSEGSGATDFYHPFNIYNFLLSTVPNDYIILYIY